MGIARLRGRPGRSWVLKLFIGLVLLVLGIGTFGVGFTLAVFKEYSQNLPSVDKLRTYQPSETTYIYSADGKLIASLYKENRVWVPFNRIPQVLKDAFIATEDSRFYEHQGFDPVGIVRAAYDDLRGAQTQGASTITMQLTRGIFLTPEQSLERKIREVLLSMEIEKKFTKDEIFELYMNQIYLGSGAYGVEAAARTYFNKHVKDLTLPEAAVIAGLPAAPSEYSPLINPEAAKDRQIKVLDRMLDTGKITHAQYVAAMKAPIRTASRQRQQALLKYPYFTSYVIHELSQKYPEDLLYRGGLRIYTTLDTRMQRIGEKVVRQHIAEDGPAFNANEAALACVENGTGYIKCLVGGTHWDQKNQFNRAWQSTRQPGSAFKIFVFSAAFEDGYTPNSLITDQPMSFKVSATEIYTPKNSDSRFAGTMQIDKCIQVSRDVPAIHMANQVGLDRVIDTANKMGIKEHIDPNLSIALGAVDVTPLEMASAVSVVPQMGVRIEPTPIKLIKDFDGNIIEDNRFPYKEPVLSEATCSAMIHCLEMVIKGGTGYKADGLGRPEAGKTGTTDEHRDAWFVGFTPEITTAVWIGNDDYSRMNHVYGGDVSAPLWGDFMKQALAKVPVHQFGVVEHGKIGVLMCKETHLRAAATCPDTVREFFAPGSVPQQWCRKHSINVVGGGRFASLNRNGLHGNVTGIHAEEVQVGSVSGPTTHKTGTSAHHAAEQQHFSNDAPAEQDTPDDVKATPGSPDESQPLDIHPTPIEPPPDVQATPFQPAPPILHVAPAHNPPPHNAAPQPPPPPPPAAPPGGDTGGAGDNLDSGQGPDR